MTSVLVLVDLQLDYLDSSGLQPAADTVVARAATLLEQCRRRSIPVVHVWTTIQRDEDRRLLHWKAANKWQCLAGTPGHAPPEGLRPIDGEAVVHKTGFDGFADGVLAAALDRAGCREVILAGVHLHTCVRAVAMGCLERSLPVTVAEDAVGSDDPTHAAAVKRWLSERCVRFLSVRDLLERLDGDGVSELVHHSPRQLDVLLFEVPVAGASDVGEATARAQAALGGWRATDVDVRARVLTRFAARLESGAPVLARQMAVEIGKPFAHGLEEVRRAAASIRDVITRAGPFVRQAEEEMVRHRPLGVVALISPWNNPVAIPAGKIAPALMYANTVVWKPAPAATGVSRAVLAMLLESGAPRDAVQLLTGDRVTARRLAENNGVDAVTFTGSGLAGYDIQEICGRRAVPLQAELGGNNPAIVWDDADVERAAAQVVWGAFGFAGQRCTANRRVIVSAGQFERVWHALVRAANDLAWQDPLDSNSDIGPVISVAKRDELSEQVERVEAEGAVHRLQRLFGQVAAAAWVNAGAYAQPVLAGCDRPSHSLVQEETMSPLLVVQRAEDFEQALVLCNGVRQGLAAALFSENAELRRRFLEGAQAGILKLNRSTAGVDVTLPFGGWKASSIGPPEHGIADPMFYTRLQTVYS